MKKLDVTGIRSGMLVAHAFHSINSRGYAMWSCSCDCGNEHIAPACSLKRGNIKSCGCVHKRGNPTHGLCETPTWVSWSSMRQRCKRHPRYAGKGIDVCERWQKFENFLSDMGERPKGFTLDRIDGSKGYSPDNCRWASASEQNTNRTTVRTVSIGSESIAFPDFYRNFSTGSVNYQKAFNRIFNLGWNPMKAISEGSANHGKA